MKRASVTTAGRRLSTATCCWLILLALLLAGCSLGRTLTVRGGTGPEFLRMVTDLRTARVIFLGEFHDRREHHRLQLQVITALQKSGVPFAIGMEMFDLESQGALDLWGEGKLGLLDFVGTYQRNWNIDWAEYDTILLFARNNRIPLVGLNVPDDIIERVANGGTGALRPADRARLPAGVSAAMDDSYRDFLRRAFVSHAMGEKGFDAFCDAQGVRNSTMALRIAAYLEQHPEQTMVVISGVGHAVRRAVPAQLALRLPRLTSRIVLPLADGELPVGVEAADADYLWEE
ncbi:MAG TPA: ChaN family lipoprotein [Geobacteraceae bacterium]